MPRKKNWIITTDGKRPLADISKDLAKAGMKERKVLSEINCITGAADEHLAPKLRQVPGVTDVSESQDINLGPPGSPETW